MRDCKKMIVAAIRRKDQHLMPKALQLSHRLAKRGDDAVHFWNEGLGEESNSHNCARLIVTGIPQR